MSDETTLLSCPFCGGEATVERIGKSGYFYVACNTAYCCDFGKFNTESEAIAAWNTRAELGSGTCYMSIVDEYETASGEEEYLCECSECGNRRWELACDLPLFCSKCGKKVER